MNWLYTGYAIHMLWWMTQWWKRHFLKETKGYTQITPDETVLSPRFKLDWFCPDCQLRPLSCGLEDNVRKKGSEILCSHLSVSKGSSSSQLQFLKKSIVISSRLPVPGLISQEFALLCSIADNSHLSLFPYMILCFYFRPNFNFITICLFLHLRLGSHPQRLSPTPFSHASCFIIGLLLSFPILDQVFKMFLQACS